VDDILIPLGFFALVAFIVYVRAQASHRRHLQTTEFHARILEKMGSAREFGEFLATDAGQRFLDAISADQSRPALGILRSVQIGLVTLAVGVGLLVMGSVTSTSESWVAFWGGVIITAIGVGTLLSAAISYRLLPLLGLTDRRKSLPHVSS